MLDFRSFNVTTEPSSAHYGGGFERAAAEESPNRKKFPFLDEEGLKRWCVEWYVDARTGKRAYGKDALLSAFLWKNGFWIELFEYAASLDDATLESMGGKLPPDRWSFAYRIKKAGFERISPKNVCVWLGAVEADRAHLVDDIGNLTSEGLLAWCHEGYEDEHGRRRYGKDVLVAAAESWDFWNAIQNYSERLSKASVLKLWGRVPKFPRMYAERFLGEWRQSITIAALFEKLSVPMPKPERVRQSSKGYLSEKELKSWCHAGYRNPKRWGKTYGKDVLLDALYSGTFWSSFERYAKSLSKLEIAEIGGLVPSTQSGYDERVAEAGFEPGAKGTCMWFWALDQEAARYCDGAGFLNSEGLSRWYWNGYLSDEGKTVLGKDVVAWCLKSGSFWKSMEKYVEGLTAEERRNMGGKFPKHAKSIGERTVGKEASIEELVGWFESAFDAAIPAEGEAGTANVESTYEWPRTRSLSDSLSQEAKWRVRSFVRQVLELADPENSVPLQKTLFKVRETENEIFVECSSKRLVAKLEQYRAYVDDTLSSEVSLWLEKPIGFDWKDFKKTGANRNNG